VAFSVRAFVRECVRLCYFWLVHSVHAVRLYFSVTIPGGVHFLWYWS